MEFFSSTIAGQMPRVFILGQIKKEVYYDVMIRDLLFKRRTCGGVI